MLDPARLPILLAPDSPVLIRETQSQPPRPLIRMHDVATDLDLTPQDTAKADQEDIGQAAPIAAAAIPAIVAKQAKLVGPVQDQVHQLIVFHGGRR
jgi:hypothetical protein